MTNQNQLTAPLNQPQHNTDRTAQRAQILAELRTGAKSTLYFREVNGICSPAPRVMELRKRGFEIALKWGQQTDLAGVKHRIGIYELISEPNDQTQGACNE